MAQRQHVSVLQRRVQVLCPVLDQIIIIGLRVRRLAPEIILDERIELLSRRLPLFVHPSIFERLEQQLLPGRSCDVTVKPLQGPVVSDGFRRFEFVGNVPATRTGSRR